MVIFGQDKTAEWWWVSLWTRGPGCLPASYCSARCGSISRAWHSYP